MLPGGQDERLHQVVVVRHGGALRLTRRLLSVQHQHHHIHRHHPVPRHHHRRLLDLERLALELQRHGSATVHQDVKPADPDDEIILRITQFWFLQLRDFVCWENDLSFRSSIKLQRKVNAQKQSVRILKTKPRQES